MKNLSKTFFSHDCDTFVPDEFIAPMLFAQHLNNVIIYDCFQSEHFQIIIILNKLHWEIVYSGETLPLDHLLCSIPLFDLIHFHKIHCTV